MNTTIYIYTYINMYVHIYIFVFGIWGAPGASASSQFAARLLQHPHLLHRRPPPSALYGSELRAHLLHWWGIQAHIASPLTSCIVGQGLGFRVEG